MLTTATTAAAIAATAAVTATAATADTNPEELAGYMVGRQVEAVVGKRATGGEVVLECRDLLLTEKTKRPVNLEVRAGEILGIAGVEGNGQQELEELLVGMRTMTQGSIKIAGQDATHLRVRKRKDLGLGYIPADRHKHAILSSFSVRENYLLGYQDSARYSKHGFINYAQLEQDARAGVKNFEVAVADLAHHIGTLSGGNQQKVVLGREVSHEPVLIIAAQPIRGLDIGAIEYVHKTLLRLKEEGKAILLISAELSEVMNLSDRIAVLYEGEVSALFDNGTYDQEEIGMFMAGKQEEEVRR